MTSRSLPERPNLEQLKKQAKSLLHAAQAKEPEALARFAALPAFAKTPPGQLAPASIAHHDAQSVVAREYGFPSWNALREHVEERTLSFTAAVDEFVRCATGNAPDRALRLLRLYPSLEHASLHTELVIGDAPAVAARLSAQPALAKQPGGIQNWEPILYVCHTCLHRNDPERLNSLIGIARQLLSLGANPNAEYHWNWHPELPRTALWAALCAVAHLPLAEVLLEHGANPTDGVSTHIAGGSGNIAALELLHRFGVDVNGIPGGVPPLRYILGWSTDISGPKWLLEHGADANLAWGETGEAPMHIAAQRWDVSMMELLARHGADLERRRADGQAPHTVAELNGNSAVAAWLVAHGAHDELSALQRFVAGCTRGDRAAARAMRHVNPALPAELKLEHHLLLHTAAEKGHTTVVETMLENGFDPRAADKDGVTALHRAAMSGHAETVRALLAHGASVNARDGMFSATPLVWAAEGWSNADHLNANHPEVARLLLEAGSDKGWTEPENAPDPERTHETVASLRRAAGFV